MHHDDTPAYTHIDLHGDVAAGSESTSRGRYGELR